MRILICSTLLIIVLLNINVTHGQNKKHKIQQYEEDDKSRNGKYTQFNTNNGAKNTYKKSKWLENVDDDDDDDDDGSSEGEKCAGKRCNKKATNGNENREYSKNSKKLQKSDEAITQVKSKKSYKKIDESDSSEIKKRNRLHRESPQKSKIKQQQIEEDDTEEDSNESDENSCEKKRTKQGKLDKCNDNSDTDETEEDDSDEREYTAKRKQVTYVKKFAHEKNAKKRKPDADDSIFKIHRGNVEKKEGKSYKKKTRYIDDSDEDSEEDHFPKRLHLIPDDDDE